MVIDLLIFQMIEAMASGQYKFVMCNFAPPDMVGHTGVYAAAVVAVEATGKASRFVFILKAY